MLFSANLYAFGMHKRKEVILGSLYAAFAFLCLFSGDFLSMLIGLELMMVISSFIIFIGGIRSSLRSAKKYFLTHIMSSNMIIIGVAHLIVKNNSFAIVPVTELLNNASYSSVMLHIMLIGMLINIAAFPFSGWMVSYYPKASPAGFLYLISFTTKVSIVLLIKLFTGYELLQYVAIIMIIYAVGKATFEENLLSILCYLSIGSMGLMLLGISNGTPVAILATFSYLFVHILYKTLLSLSFVSIIDKTGHYDCRDLKKVRSKILIISFIIGAAMMINFPMSSSFYIKSSIASIFINDKIYFVTILLSFMSVFVLPWKKYLASKEYFTIELNIYTKIALLFMSLVVFIIAIAGKYLPILSNLKEFQTISLFNAAILNQAIIILSGLTLAIILQAKRSITKPINLIELIGDVLFYFYARWSNNKIEETNHNEPFAIETLERQIMSKLNSLHSQQTAIFIVFAIFIAMLILAAIKF
jgi:multicomponent Na+:H+ antiporter subunit D